ncbi:MAG: hypothetical protein EXR11_01270 [Rhodospirillaceae bacterium]|nr:hypothetical protein [Rhodospirillaceae bacterium]
MRLSALLTTLFVLSTGANAAECVQVVFRDLNGVIVKSDIPVIGLVVEGIEPVVNIPYEPTMKKEKGAPAACPADLIEMVRGWFTTTCISEQGRAAAIQGDAKGDAELVKTRCAAMYKAIN